MLERRHVQCGNDTLTSKIHSNFSSAPVIEHITAVSAATGSPLVYYMIHYRFEWSVDADDYVPEEQLFTWVVPKEGNLKFVLEEVTKEMRLPSLRALITKLRTALMIEDPAAITHSGDMHLAPELEWKAPLHTLYELLIEPVVDFISAYGGYSDCEPITVVPDRWLWLVPFAALMDPTDKYLVEHFIVRHAFSATQVAYASLNAVSVAARKTNKKFVVEMPDAATSSVRLPFAPDTHRAAREATAICNTIHAEAFGKAAVDISAFRDFLPRSRFLHIVTPVVSSGADGGLYAITSYDHTGILRCHELATLEVPCELVVHSNANISPVGVAAEQEGVLTLCRTWLSCGASCVLTSTWCTPDMTPQHFFVCYYTTLNECGDKSRALTLAMRKQLEHDRFAPRNWASYVVIGAARV